ncbi:hypothetical protein K3495_g388 [Podosphaera aphanis]|nr:hypothetical protein K3495_g388 [Podosphaera aphanis]
MFRFHKTLDVVTLFHKANSPASEKALNILKQACTKSSAVASKNPNCDSLPLQRDEFQLEVTEELPTQDQLRSILEYAGPSKLNSIVKEAQNKEDALQALRANRLNFQKPIIVDWARGNVVATTNESEILKMINSVPKKEP